MRRVVAEYLEPRLCRDAVSVVNTTVPVDDAIALLRANLMWSLVYDAGRLLGDVSVRGLLEGGHVDVARRWAELAERPTVLHRALRGETITDDELAACSEDDRIDLRLAARCLRGEASAPVPLGEEPVQPLGDDPADARILDLHDYVATGDHAGCLRALRAAITHWSAQPDARRAWPRLARVCRLLTGDDAAAMALLERVRLSDVHDEWVEIFGAAGVARIQRAKDAVLAAIDRAFDGVPFPGPKHRSLYQAEAADNWAGCDQSRDHKGRWQELPREQILACQFALPHLPAESMPYYFPAVMSFVVREHDQKAADHGSRWIFESTEYTLAFSLDDARGRAYQRDRFRLFTPAQLAAVAAFADYYRCGDADRARWHAVGRGEPWPAP